MCRKIVWCYGFILTFLDISLNTKLTAQGKSHGVNAHDSYEGASYQQEWGGLGGAPLLLSPPALHFGAQPLAAPHALTVTVTNAGNTTLHLASLAGTTPHFHASFFHTKTLPPEGNTSFTVVFLGRREGPVSAHLYIHTSRGIHRYPVSAVGVCSPWQLWPWSLRVPRGAQLLPTLSITNPTPKPAQVLEIYSSAEWVQLELPSGGPLDAARWALPARGSRELLALRVTPPGADRATAYVSIKIQSSRGAVRLVLAVEAAAAPAGEYLAHAELRLRRAATRDPAPMVSIAAGNAGARAAAVRGRLAAWARCGAGPAGAASHAALQHNGGSSEGVSVTVLVDELPPNQPPIEVAVLNINYLKLWESRTMSEGSVESDGSVWCWGAVKLGKAQIPLSVSLHHGSVRYQPDRYHVVWADPEAGRARPVLLHNLFQAPLHVQAIEKGPNFDDYLILSDARLGVIPAGALAPLASLRPRPPGGSRSPPGGPGRPRSAITELVTHTNYSSYTLPIYLYEGLVDIEWDSWYSGKAGLELGVVPGGGVAVRARLRNPSPARLCLTALAADVQQGPAAARFTLDCDVTLTHCMCIEANGSRDATLTVTGAGWGALAGRASVGSAWGRRQTALRGTAMAGTLRVRLRGPGAPGGPGAPQGQGGPAAALLAPYCGTRTDIILESTLGTSMRILNITTTEPDPSVSFEWTSREVEDGGVIGSIIISPERACGRRCYSGGVTWEAGPQGAGPPGGGALERDAEDVSERADVFEEAEQDVQVPLCVRTSGVVRACAALRARARWPRLAPGGARAPLAAPPPAPPQHAPLALANPSATHPLLVQPVLHTDDITFNPDSLPDIAVVSNGCSPEKHIFSPSSVSLAGWKVRRGSATPLEGNQRGQGGPAALPWLLLGPSAEVELQLMFAPQLPDFVYSYLYIRNNLTVVEAVRICGEGAAPRLQLVPGAERPVTVEVSECGVPGRAVLTVANVGRVGAPVRGASVAGGGCRARGVRVSPCGPFQLAPNATRPLVLEWSAGTLTKQTVKVQLGALTVTVRGKASPAVLQACHVATPSITTRVALLIALVALPAALYAAIKDAERLLRQAPRRTSPRPPLDLRTLNHTAPPVPAPVLPVPAPRRKKPRKCDPLAEARAFDRWRASLTSPDQDEPLPPPPQPEGGLSGGPGGSHLETEAHTSTEEDTSTTSDDSTHTQEDNEEETSEVVHEQVEDVEDIGELNADVAQLLSCTVVEQEEIFSREFPEEPEEEAEDAETASLTTTEPERVSPPRTSPTANAVRSNRRSSTSNSRRSERGRGAGGAGTPGGPRSRRGARRAPSPPRAPPAGLRAGASWSSVVVGAPLAPPAPPAPPSSHSLFYYSAAPPAASPQPPARAPRQHYPWHTPTTTYHTPHDYREEKNIGTEEASGGAFGSIGCAWGSGNSGGGAWWRDPEPAAGSLGAPGSLGAAGGLGAAPGSLGAAGPLGTAPGSIGGGLGTPSRRPRTGLSAAPGNLRPPPGFGSAPVKEFDPFQSPLASIWTRDWSRPEEPANH